MSSTLRMPCWLGVLALGMWSGCGGDPKAPVLGPNLVTNGSFESELSGWWTAKDSELSTATTSADAADYGAAGLVLHKGPDGWYSMVGQSTQGHGAWQTIEVHARLKGAAGGEHVTFGYDDESFEIIAEPRWRTVSRMVLMPESSDSSNARISITTNDATVYVDEVSFSTAEVERGEADEKKDNLLHNGSFESELGQWTFWASAPEGSASTAPEARHSGYAGLELVRGPEGTITLVKQSLRDPIAKWDQYHIDAYIRGAQGGELVNLCMQIEHDPWTGPCVYLTATKEWQHISENLPIDESMLDERVSIVIAPGGDGTAMVDDVVVTRTQPK